MVPLLVLLSCNRYKKKLEKYLLKLKIHSSFVVSRSRMYNICDLFNIIENNIILNDPNSIYHL